MAAKGVLSATLSLRKPLIVPKKETKDAKAKRLIKVKSAKEWLIKAKDVESTFACLTCDLFHKFLTDQPKIQWDCIVTKMHTKNPWMAIMGDKHNGLRSKLGQSLTDCIKFHKLTVFTVDTAERVKYCLMYSIKKTTTTSGLSKYT